MNPAIRVLFLTLSFFLLLLSCKKDVIEPSATEQISVPTTNDLNRILFVNDSTGYIAGGDKYNSTELLITSDGGKTWGRYFPDQNGNKAVYGLCAFGTRVYAVGYDGKFYSKTPQDPDWQMKQTNYWEWFQSVTFTGPNTGFIVSGEGYRAGRIYRTDAEGTLSLVDSFEFQLTDIQFINEQVGYISGYGSVLKTEDGGSSWTLQDIKGDFFKSISCVGQEHVWSVGYNGTIIHTGDGGIHWERQRNGDNPLIKKYRLRAVRFKDIHTGYAAGDKGLLLKTADGGEHWSEFKRLTDSDLKCITLHPDGSIWVAGAGGTVFHIRE